MAVSISLSITQNSQSIANNTSNVTVKVIAKWTTGSFNRNDPSGSCTINGTKYTFTSDFNANNTTTGSQTIFTKTLNITHNSDGTKTLSCSASYVTGVSSGTVTASASKTLTTIPRKSTMSVGNGTLGTSQTLTVTRKSTSFTHTIVATCGSASTTICTKSTSTSIPFTPPIAWSSQNTTGTSVSVKYTITTYSGSTNVGSNSYTVSCGIPASVKPSCSLTVSDPTGCLSTYGAYIQGLSKFTVSISASGSYGSTIKSYKTVVNGGTYTASSFTTSAITTTGTYTINTTVTDSRSRTATASKPVSVTVLAYAAPKLSSFSVKRCNSDGTINNSGSYMKVSFNSSVTSLSSKNKATYTLKYKKSTDSAYTSVTLSSYANNYAVSGGSYIFAADITSSYNVTLSVADAFKTITATGTGSTASKTMSLYKEGKGIAFGKIAETSNVLESAWNIKGAGTDNWLGKFRFNGEYIGLYDTANGGTRKGWIGHNGTTNLTIKNEASGNIRFEGNAVATGVFYFANGTTYYINTSGGANLQNIVANGVLQATGATTLKSTLAVTGNTTLTGWLKPNGAIYLPNAKSLYGYNTSSSALDIASVTSSNNIAIGNGTYTKGTGNTNVWGNFVFINSGNDIGFDCHKNKSYVGQRMLMFREQSGSYRTIFKPETNGTCFLGTSGYRWNTAFFTNAITASDLKEKDVIEDFDFKVKEFIMSLQPIAYTRTGEYDGGKRIHLGLGAQTVAKNINDLELGNLSLVQACIINEDGTETPYYGEEVDDEILSWGINYTELIAPLIKMTQEQENEINSLKKENQQIKEELQLLKEMVAKLVS